MIKMWIILPVSHWCRMKVTMAAKGNGVFLPGQLLIEKYFADLQ